MLWVSFEADEINVIAFLLQCAWHDALAREEAARADNRGVLADWWAEEAERRKKLMGDWTRRHGAALRRERAERESGLPKGGWVW